MGHCSVSVDEYSTVQYLQSRYQSASPAPPAIRACCGILLIPSAALEIWLRLDTLVDMICDLNGLMLTGNATRPEGTSSGLKN